MALTYEQTGGGGGGGGEIEGIETAGSASTAKPVLIGGKDNTGDLQAALCDQNGNLLFKKVSENSLSATNIDSVGRVAINLSAGNNQQLVAAPGASKQIWVTGYAFTCSAAGTTVSFQDEDDTALSGVISFAQYGGIVRQSVVMNDVLFPIYVVPTNKALEVDVATGDVDGDLQYVIVSV